MDSIITASNGISLSIDDLKEAVKSADVNWIMAAYANDRANSKDPIDICMFDFFNNSDWELVDEAFVHEYGKCENKHIALAHIIKNREKNWSEWANQQMDTEETCYMADGTPFSFAYAQLYLACEHESEYYLDYKDTIFSKTNNSNYTGYKVENGYTNYNYNFVWGDVNYTVTLMYEGNLIDSQEFRDGQPDCISIKVAKE